MKEKVTLRRDNLKKEPGQFYPAKQDKFVHLRAVTPSL